MFKNEIPIMSEYIDKCEFNFDGIKVKVAKSGSFYAIKISTDLDLMHENLPREYRVPGSPRIEKSFSHDKEWFVPGFDKYDLHFNNGTRFTYDQIEHILFCIKKGGLKLKEIENDKKIRISLDDVITSKTFNFHGVEIIVVKKCNHISKCDDSCKYAIEIVDNEIVRELQKYQLKYAGNRPGKRGEFEGTSSFHKSGNFNWYVSRFIDGKKDSPSLTFANKDILFKCEIEYALFSIKKNLDKHAEVGNFELIRRELQKSHEKEVLKQENKEFLNLPVPDAMRIIIKSAENGKVKLLVRGMRHISKLPHEYFKNKNCYCCAYSDGTFTITHGDKMFIPEGVETNNGFYNLCGTVMTEEASYKVIAMLMQCSSELYRVNHPNSDDISTVI